MKGNKRGRPRKGKTKDTGKPLSGTSASSSGSPNQETLTDKVQAMFQTPSPNQNQNPSLSNLGSGSPGDNFQRTAAELENKYGDSFASAAGEGAPNSAADLPPVEIIPPVDVISDATCRKYLRLFFASLAKNHGEHWQLTSEDEDVLSPVTVDMLNEQVPQWLADSQNKALIIWAGVMATFIAVRSQAGARLVEWLMQKITGGAATTVDATTKQGSQG